MARRWRRVAGWSFLVLVLLLLIAITATVGWRPFLGPRARAVTDRTFASTPQRLERGRYLSTAMGCFACHSPFDMQSPGRPAQASMLAAGRVWTDEGMPWLVAPNITPDRETGAGTWSDDTLARAIREGVGHDGRALFPIMPYGQYRRMSDEDLASIIVYLRTLKPIRNPLPKTKIPFPPGPLINNVPQPIDEPVPPPAGTDPVSRGRYLVEMTACRDCHTPMVRGEFLTDLEYGGGFVLKGPEGDVASSNLTPDPSGIPYYTEDAFLQVMKTGMLGARKINDVMPWVHFRNFTDEDLKAMFAYVKTFKPVKHTVDNSLPPTDCKRCQARHGGGEKN